MHGIFYDEIHDEIVVPVALGGAILTLPGDAAGDAPPKRVLQGPKTGIVQPDTIYVDLKNDELIVESGDDAVLVFPRTAYGDVKPTRRIGGPNAGINNIYGLACGRDSIVVANRVEVVREAARVTNSIVVLKGHQTLIADPEGHVSVNPTGNPGMASGGMGDVLGGMIAAFLARGVDGFDAAATAVYLHGYAGDMVKEEMGDTGMAAMDLANRIPLAIRRLREG